MEETKEEEEVDEGKIGEGGERKEEEDLRWFGRRLTAPLPPPPPSSSFYFPPPPTLESETLGKLMWSGEEGKGGRGV